MNQIYKNNLAALNNINPNLARKVNELETRQDDFVVEPIQNGQDYTLKIIEDDQERLVHSCYNPRIQAQKTINKLKLGYYNLIGVAGIGCGHYIREILEEFNSESQVVIIENRLDILKEVMKKKDLTDILDQKRNIQIFDGSDKKYISKMKNNLRRIDYLALVAGNVDFFKTPVLQDVENEKYIEFRKKFFSTLNFIIQIMGNDPGDSILGLEHAFSNLEYVLQSPTLDNIDYFENKPAVCVAAGPSLDKNIDILKKYQDKVLIIAADTILEKLLNYGITPDIVGVLERTESVYNYFFKKLAEEDRLPEETTLIAEGVIHPKIFDNYPGKKVTVFRDTVHSEDWFSKAVGDITSFDTGNSVANLNFSIALRLGCDPIVFIGQDLALSNDGEGHATGTGYDELGEERDKWKIVDVEGYNGEKLKTRKWWKVFKEWFEYRIVEVDVNCIDATEGGAYIEGTEVKNLQETANKYFIEDLPNFSNKINEVPEDKIKERISNLNGKIKKKIDNLKKIQDKIKDILDILKKDREKVESILEPGSFVEQEFGNINTEIAKMSQMDNVLFFICQAIIVQIERYKVQLGDLSINTVNKFKKWCNYEIDKLNDIKEITDILINLLDQGKEDLNEYDDSSKINFENKLDNLSNLIEEI
ncbi:motility associated factor glycosyltransferase family protein [Halanaerobacter jeridensis]|uniref:6-hydroxymethylpterin diphosphokinase MptE-like domain-containing protein n=1 Tax=Halanaerobacter jeridensis TaxID=706427 RepID=A0A938XTX0_9FIRM|nr:6-hydroxymethylpterin diphosphokinase MptE-like protein [Halanaerobacter jeridensis]MBM7557463.1 hypothetical protein [Halanaerobacter jeridensis]